MKTKVCAQCSVEKPVHDFNPSPNGADGYSRCCSSCWSSMTESQRNNLMAREYRRENLETSRRKTYRQSLKRRLGVSIEEHDTLMVAQGGVCAICGVNNGERRLHLDHCHTTGKIRALLCSGCNVGLGGFKDNVDLLQKAIDYLQTHKS